MSKGSLRHWIASVIGRLSREACSLEGLQGGLLGFLVGFLGFLGFLGHLSQEPEGATPERYVDEYYVPGTQQEPRALLERAGDRLDSRV
jgi:hypothetical protein